MYICICNGFKEKDMCRVIDNGASSVGQVYKHLGCKPQCGQCVEMVREALTVNKSSGASA